MLTTKTVKIGFIGYGNMAGATGRGLVLSGAICPDQIYACAKNYEKLCLKAEAEGIHPCRTPLEIAEKCDVVFIGVKPYMVEDGRCTKGKGCNFTGGQPLLRYAVKNHAPGSLRGYSAKHAGFCLRRNLYL